MKIPEVLTNVDLNGFPKLQEHKAAKTNLDSTTIDSTTYAEICRLQAQQSSHSIQDEKITAINTLGHHAYHTYDPKANTQGRKRPRTADTADNDGRDDDDVLAGSGAAMWQLLQKIDKKLDDVSAKVSNLEMESAIERGRRANYMASTLGGPWGAVRRRAPSDPPLDVIRSIKDLCDLNNEALAHHVRQHAGDGAPQAATQAQFDLSTRVRMRYILAQELGVLLTDSDKLLIGSGPGQA